MKLLIIGGSRFVGRHLIEAALAANHEITTFNRGQSNPGVYPSIEELHGDRDGDLAALAGRKWDAVIDTCGYVPRIVRKSAEYLRDAVERYVFVSSISVYANLNAGDTDERTGTLHQLDDPNVETVTGETYGGLKVLCERVITEIYGERGLNARPGFIVGSYDPTWRLPYLTYRFSTTGQKVAGRADQPVQIIHARDLGMWMLGAIKQQLYGDYNLTGDPVMMADLLSRIAVATGSDAEPIYVGDKLLKSHEIAPIDCLTYWLPTEAEAVMRVNIQRAKDTGLTQLPLDAISADVWSWTQQRDWSAIPDSSPVITPEREAAILADHGR